MPSVTDRFMGGSGNSNYLVEDDKILRGGSFEGNRGVYRTRLNLAYNVPMSLFYIYELW
jgi:hypothetical protein